jgi:hypothetical protein
MYPRYRCAGRFYGRRVNCENVPLLPAWAVRWVLSDPRMIPYLLLWQSPWDGEVKEAVRVAAYSEPGPCDWTGWVEIKRANGTHTLVRTVQRPLPRRAGKALLMICPYCHSARRALYGWQLNLMRARSFFGGQWQCRACAGLRYASEGGALLIRSRGIIGRLLGVGRSDRPEPWFPYVFTDPCQAAEIAIKSANSVVG